MSGGVTPSTDVIDGVAYVSIALFPVFSFSWFPFASFLNGLWRAQTSLKVGSRN